MDPDTEAGRVWSKGILPFSKLPQDGCLVLMGEPGIGKTATMASQRPEIEQEVLARGDQSLWVDLSACPDSHVLYRHLFDSAEYQEWLKGSHTLHLFLDSLDECLLQIEAVGALLIREFSTAPVNRMRLRVACRTAEWPRLLEGAMTTLFGEKVGYYELVPLRRADVVDAARQYEVDPERFLDEVDRCSAKHR